MKVIGITGGIGTGKSTVSDYLREKGYYIIDADQRARDMTAAGSPAIDRIAAAFGEGFVDKGGNLDRGKLARLVFVDADKKKTLESIVTKGVIESVNAEIKHLRSSGTYDIIFLDAPILFETGAEKSVDAVWLVTAAMDTRLQRVMTRDKTGKDDILNRINNQMPENKKAAMSQEIIDNSKGKDELYHQVDALISKYVETA